MRRVGRGTIALGLLVPFTLGIGLGAVISGDVFGGKDVAVPEGWSHAWRTGHVLEGDDVVLVWGDEVGDDPARAAETMRFDPARTLSRLERFYDLDVDELDVAREDGPVGDHKIVVVATGTWSEGPGKVPAAAVGRVPTGLGTLLGATDQAPAAQAQGSVTDAGVGLLEVSVAALQGDGWELARGFAEVVQHFAVREHPASGLTADTAATFWDASAGYLASVAVPGRAGDLADLVRSPELAWSSPRLGTGGRLLLQYLAERDGPRVLGELWRGTEAGEAPLAAYGRLAGLSAEALNRRVAEYAMRMVTWDLTASSGLAGALADVDPLLVASRSTPVEPDPAAPGVYRVIDGLAPSDQGYAAVRLVPEQPGTTVTVQVRGHAEASPGAGWSYGVVAVGDGTARYSTVTEGPDGTIDFTLRERESELYLVVVGTPTTVRSYGPDAGARSTYRYPFEIGVDGATAVPVDESVAVAGVHRHANGGGWVDDAASVAESVYVAPGAVVRGAARLSGEVRVEGRAWVAGGAELSGAVVVRDSAVVGPAARLSGDVVVGGDAVVDLTCARGAFLTFDPSLTCDEASDGSGPPDVNGPVTAFAPAELGRSAVEAPVDHAVEEPPTDVEEQAGPVQTERPAAEESPSAPAHGHDGAEDRPTSRGVAPPDPVSAGCSATYTAKTWPDGFQGHIVLTAGPEGLQAWTVTWTLPHGQQVTGAWGVMLGTRGDSVTGENTSWNGAVAPGQSITLGVQGTAKGDAGAVVPTVTCTRTR